jgi:hypothetical protein
VLSNDEEGWIGNAQKHVRNSYVQKALIFEEKIWDEVKMAEVAKFGFEYSLINWGTGKTTDLWEYTVGVRSTAMFIDELHAITAMHENMRHRVIGQ